MAEERHHQLQVQRARAGYIPGDQAQDHRNAAKNAGPGRSLRSRRGRDRQFRSLANHCSSIFANVAGELICQWTEGDEDANVYFPSADIKSLIAEVSKVDEDVRNEDDLNKGSVYNVARSNNEAPGSKEFYCLRPLSKDEIAKLSLDGENVVKCPMHGPQRNPVDCVYCHARQQQLVEKADVLCRQAEKKSDARGVQEVFCPLASARQIPMELWKYPGAKESARMDGSQNGRH